LHKDVLVASVHANSRPIGSSSESGTDFSMALLSFRLFRRQASDRGHDRLLLLSCCLEEEEEEEEEE
tara:strand:+ start:377 stop:577 length:201 start_codon:yes stop_codon:yes gene_type:complete